MRWKKAAIERKVRRKRERKGRSLAYIRARNVEKGSPRSITK